MKNIFKMFQVKIKYIKYITIFNIKNNINNIKLYLKNPTSQLKATNNSDCNFFLAFGGKIKKYRTMLW